MPSRNNSYFCLGKYFNSDLFTVLIQTIKSCNYKKDQHNQFYNCKCLDYSNKDAVPKKAGRRKNFYFSIYWIAEVKLSRVESCWHRKERKQVKTVLLSIGDPFWQSSTHQKCLDILGVNWLEKSHTFHYLSVCTVTGD